MPVAATVAAVGAGTAVVSSNAAKSAAKTQAQSAQAGLDVQERIYQQNRADLAPFRDIGLNALQRLRGELGDSFQTSPGYDFVRTEALNDIDNTYAARGGFRSGARLKALQDRAAGIASTEYGNYFARLQSLAGVAQTSTNNLVNVGQNFGMNAAQSLRDAGDARASGYVGQANAITGGINNAVGLYGILRG